MHTPLLHTKDLEDPPAALQKEVAALGANLRQVRRYLHAYHASLQPFPRREWDALGELEARLGQDLPLDERKALTQEYLVLGKRMCEAIWARLVKDK